MRHAVEIENIEEMRRKEGIEDIQLRDEIRGLRVGDFVRLTLVGGTVPAGRETLLVRLTSIKAHVFRGKLADQPKAGGGGQLRLGALLNFTPDHIHSIMKRH